MAKSYRKFLVGSIATAVVGSAFAGVVGAASSYNDVNSKYQAAVDFVVSKGIVGTSDTTFGTYENIKRVDAAVFVAKVLGLNTTSAPAAGFTDVPERAKGAVNALKAAGITSGKSASIFGAQDYITRGELAIWIQKGFGLQAGHEALAFADVSDKYADAVNALVSNKVTNGTSATSFGTYDNAKRGDFAIFLQRANDAKKVEKPSALKIEGDNTGNSLVNGSSKTYTVTFTNPVSGKPMVNEIVNVTFEENLNTNFEQQRKVTVTNASGQSVIPYQSNNGQEAGAQIRTDKDGKATFTITGTNATVTPIAFVDGSNQYWDANAGHRDFRTYADNRFDKETEIFVKAPAVTFGTVAYKIAVTGERTNEATVSEVANGQITQQNGRVYKIKVTKPDGSVFAGGTVNVGIDEYLDGKLGNEPRAAFLRPEAPTQFTPVLPLKTIGTANGNIQVAQQATVVLDANGEAEFRLASTNANDSARPVVWIDQNYDNASGNNTLEAGEPVSVRADVSPTNFQPVRVDNARLRVVDLTAEARAAFPGAPATEDVKGFNLQILNQSGTPWLPPSLTGLADSRVTFEVVNNGAHPIRIHTANGIFTNPTLQNAVLADFATVTGTPNGTVVDVGVGGRVTIAGNINAANFYNQANGAMIAIHSVGGKSSASVKANAVVDSGVGQGESRNIAVSAGPVSYDVFNTSNAPRVIEVIERDTNRDAQNRIDEIELVFDKDVVDFEAGDFRLFVGTTDINQSAIGATYGKEPGNLTKEDKTRVVLKVEEFAGIGDPNATLPLLGATRLYYDPSFSGTKALSDGFGNQTRAFIVTDNGNNGSYEVNPK